VIQIGLSRKIATWMDAQRLKIIKFLYFQLVRGLIVKEENDLIVGLKSEEKD
jgi:hypothetical protein